MLIFAFGACFTFLRGAIFNMAGERVVARVRRRLFAAILSQEIGFFDKVLLLSTSKSKPERRFSSTQFTLTPSFCSATHTITHAGIRFFF